MNGSSSHQNRDQAAIQNDLSIEMRDDYPYQILEFRYKIR